MIFITATIGVIISGIYIAAAARVWQRRGKWWTLLPAITAGLYTWGTSSYIWDIVRGQVEGEGNFLSLLLFLLPALLVFQVIRWSWRDDANASAIIRKYEND